MEKKNRKCRKKKLLSPHSRRVLQDLADADRELIATNMQRTISAISDLNDENLLVHNPRAPFIVLVDNTDIFQDKVQNEYADQKISKSKVQQVPRESPPQKTCTRLPVLNSPIIGTRKSVGNFVNEGLRRQYKESRFALAGETYQKPRQHLHLESAFRPSSSFGQFDYWRGNVHNMNYPNMRNWHLSRQKHETEKASKQTRARSGKSFGILTLTNSSQWVPKKAILPPAFKKNKEVKVRVITCFNCGKPGHKALDCPEPKKS